MKNKKLFNKCTRLWSEIVKMKAGYVSEYSGQAGSLNSHHLLGKSSYALRFDTRGGICLTAGEHKLNAHSDDNYSFVTELREIVKRREGENIIEILEMQKNRTGSRLEIIVLELEQELRELELNEK
jgi:hypothetical protein